MPPKDEKVPQFGEREPAVVDGRIMVEGEKPAAPKKDWRQWGTNLIKRRTTKQLMEDALLVRFKERRTVQVLSIPFPMISFNHRHQTFFTQQSCLKVSCPDSCHAS